jgi:predicted transglutaminase-like cysteine proteinase
MSFRNSGMYHGHTLRAVAAFCLFSLLLAVGAAFIGHAAAAPTPIRLFGTVEFRGEIKNLPRWERIIKAEQSSPAFDQDLNKFMSPSVAEQWQTMLKNLRDAPIMEKARAVNNFFNRWPYKRDVEIYGVEMYWPTPAEFMRNSGMCHGYAITKFYALLKMGVPEENMRIVALNDTIRNIGHAVLVV